MQNSLTKKLGLSVAALALAVTSLFTASDAQAVPAFARQTGMSCSSCHYMAFPALNGMGRNFKAGGYTMKGVQTSIEGERIDLPSNLNMSGIWKTYHEKVSGHATGEVIWPDEAALLVGGRANANTGFLWEVGLGAQEVDGAETNGNFLSTKMHFNVSQSGSMNISLIPFNTDALGSAYGFELMNTATQRSQRSIENRRAMNASQWFNIGTGAAMGVAIVATDLASGWWANLSLWGPGTGGNGDLTGLAQHIRVGYFFDLAGFDSGVGFLTRSGAMKSSTDGGKTQDVNYAVAGTMIDFQMQGESLGLWVTQTTAGDSTSVSSPSVPAAGYASGGGSGLGITVKYDVSPLIKVHYATSSGKIGDAKEAHSSVGADFLVSENIQLQIFQKSSQHGSAAAESALVMGWFAAL